MKKYDEYGIEQKTINIRPYITLFVIVALFLGISFLILFNIDNIKNFIKDTGTKIKEKQNKKENENSEFKLINGLYVPEFDNPMILNDSSNKLTLNITNIEATTKGYELTIEGKNESNYIGYIECNRIQVEKYDVETTFDMEISPKSKKEIKIIIKKTELNKLEINNFINMKFYLNVSTSYNSEPREMILSPIIKKQFEVDSEKKGLINIYNKNSMKISYYKKITDSDKHYLYFELNNESGIDYEIYIQKLLLDGSIYEPKIDKWTSLKKGKRIYIIDVPKDEYNTLSSMSISFILINKTKEPIEYYEISDQKEVDLK